MIQFLVSEVSRAGVFTLAFFVYLSKYVLGNSTNYAFIKPDAFFYLCLMEQIKIIKESCGGCPMIWDVTLNDGSAGYIRYRWGIISLKKVTERAGIFQEPIISEQIGDEYDGMLSLDEAKKWLENNGYKII